MVAILGTKLGHIFARATRAKFVFKLHDEKSNEKQTSPFHGQGLQWPNYCFYTMGWCSVKYVSEGSIAAAEPSL